MPDSPVTNAEAQSVAAVPVHKELQFKCSICSRSLSTMTGLIMHTRKIHKGSKIRKCQKCGKLCKSMYHLGQHMRTHGVGLPLNAYKCQRCQKAFAFKHRLITHARIEHNMKLISQNIREFVPTTKQIPEAKTRYLFLIKQLNTLYLSNQMRYYNFIKLSAKIVYQGSAYNNLM